MIFGQEAEFKEKPRCRQSVEQILERLKGGAVEAAFDAGWVTSDAGGLLLKATGSISCSGATRVWHSGNSLRPRLLGYRNFSDRRS